MRLPTVFISYSHDSEADTERVLALADRLRQDGVDAILDRYEAVPPQGWAHWMHEQVTTADFVLMICTESCSEMAAMILTRRPSPDTAASVGPPAGAGS